MRPTQVLPIMVQGAAGIRIEPIRWCWLWVRLKQLLIKARTERVGNTAA